MNDAQMEAMVSILKQATDLRIRATQERNTATKYHYQGYHEGVIEAIGLLFGIDQAMEVEKRLNRAIRESLGALGDLSPLDPGTRQKLRDLALSMLTSEEGVHASTYGQLMHLLPAEDFRALDRLVEATDDWYYINVEPGETPTPEWPML